MARTRFEPVGSAVSSVVQGSETPSHRAGISFAALYEQVPETFLCTPTTVTTCAMDAPNTTTMPTWQQTALEKRRVRDEAIQKFLDMHEVSTPTSRVVLQQPSE